MNNWMNNSIWECVYLPVYMWCISAPAQQPPPTHKPLSSTSIALFWGPPDYPNGIIKQYNIVRNGTVLTSLDNFSMFRLP